MVWKQLNKFLQSHNKMQPQSKVGTSSRQVTGYSTYSREVSVVGFRCYLVIFFALDSWKLVIDELSMPKILPDIQRAVRPDTEVGDEQQLRVFMVTQDNDSDTVFQLSTTRGSNHSLGLQNLQHRCGFCRELQFILPLLAASICIHGRSQDEIALGPVCNLS